MDGLWSPTTPVWSNATHHLSNSTEGEAEQSLWPAQDTSFGQYHNASYCLAEEGFLTSPAFHMMVYTLYLPILFISLTGNAIVCHLIINFPRMRTVTNFFIFNLSLGDILMSFFCILFTSYSTLILRHWPFGDFLCKMVSFTQALAVFVSVYTLVSVSIIRFIGVKWPLRPPMAKCSACVLIGTIWLAASLTSAPIYVVSGTIQPDDTWEQCDMYTCQEIWNDASQEFAFNVILMTLQYLIPFVVLMVTNSLMAFIVWGRQIPGEANNVRDQRITRGKKKMIKMMVVMVAIFTISWFPFNSFLFANIFFREEIKSWTASPYIFLVFHWMAMSHAIWNPIIYAYMSRRFRRGYKCVLSKVPFCRQILSLRHGDRDASMAEYPMAAMEGSILHRVNTVNTSSV